MKLSEEQKDAKIAFLTQQVNQLRDALLNYQIAAGEISLREKGE